MTAPAAKPPALTEGNSEAEAAMTAFIKARTAHQTVLKDKYVIFPIVFIVIFFKALSRTKKDEERRSTLEVLQTAQKSLTAAMAKFDSAHYQRVVVQNQATQDWLISEMVKDADVFIKQNEDRDQGVGREARPT